MFKVGTLSKAQKALTFKRRTFRLFENLVCCKISKKVKGDSLETLKKLQKSLTKPKRVPESLIAPKKNWKGGPLCFGMVFYRLWMRSKSSTKYFLLKMHSAQKVVHTG